MRKFHDKNYVIREQMRADLPDEPPKKKFKKKYDLPLLDDYCEEPDSTYWDDWPKLSWEEGIKIKSNIDPSAFREFPRETNFPFPVLLNKIYLDLEKGASLGVSQDCQVSSTSTNAPSAYEEGEKVSDALASWISEGFAIGPFKPEEVPFEVTKYSGLMTKKKPNGSVRIILNFSQGKPKSLNEGINSKEFPTAMSNTDKWIRILLRCGKGARFCKIDWASAYKQLRARQDQVWMQGFRWLGRVFFELCHVFGGKSSPGLYDRLAKVVLWIVLVKSYFPEHLCIQHLDDVCGASPDGWDKVDRFYNTYQDVCNKLGVELADPSDADKMFSPRTNGHRGGAEWNLVLEGRQTV